MRAAKTAAKTNVLRRSMPASLARDERGITAVTTGLALAMLTGFAGLAVDASAWQTAKRDMQGAADQAAYSAAIGAKAGANGTLNAKGVTAQMGYVDGQKNVTVTVHNPPSSGPNNANNQAWEVVINKPQPMWFARMFMRSAPTATARAVALPGVQGNFCLLALDPASSGEISVQGNPSINTPACNIMANSSSSSALTIGGSASVNANTFAAVGNPGYSINSAAGKLNATVKSGAPALSDPYKSISVPASSSWGTCQAAPTVGNGKTVTITAGCYTGAFSVPNSGTLVLGAGTYYIDRGSISTSGGTITSNGAGVTIVLTSATGSGWSTISIGGNATINLKAQSTGTYEGLVIYADRRMPNGTAMSLGGGSNQSFTGDLYFPSTLVTFGGNSSSSSACTRLIAWQIILSGNSTFQSGCPGTSVPTLAGFSTYLAE